MSKRCFFNCFILLALSSIGTFSCSGNEEETKKTSPDAEVSLDATVPDSAFEDDELVVTIEDGKIKGELVGESRRYLKIPYAKPPVGPLRWKAPIKNLSWGDQIREEKDFSDGCPQNASAGSQGSRNEDCLYLNVRAPRSTAKKAAVMVWIHGGGNFAGSTRDTVTLTDPPQLWFDGQWFAAKQGVVLVTINYRLGPLGFFAHPDLPKEGSPFGNQGLLDQRMALQWVQKNIEKFGGDPENVTIFGESAGSADVCLHMVSPGSRGLFHRAISESGGCTTRFGLQVDSDDRAKAIETFTEALGCKGTEDELACLREKPIDDIMANAAQPNPTAGITGKRQFSFTVVIDGADGFLPDTPRALFEKKRIAEVPYLLGSNTDEGTIFLLSATGLPTNDEEYVAYLKGGFGDYADQIAALYPPSNFNGSYRDALVRVIGDSSLVCSTHDTARRAAKAGLDVFMYNFNVPWSIVPSLLGAAHASEISHVFGNPYKPTPESQAVSDAMNSYWARFAKTGDPNGEDAPAQWPKFVPDTDYRDKRLQLDPNWETLIDYRKEECTFWRSYYDAQSQL
ncbi:MAG: carboxylesterase family protein [Deltaproteobacteria bacterium]|nr:carboxylesterase family protein [Deltaproteobacteria bacterium]